MERKNDYFQMDEMNTLAVQWAYCTDKIEKQNYSIMIADRIMRCMRSATDRGVVTVFRTVTCTEDVFIEALGVALSEQKGYSPERGMKFSTYFIEQIKILKKREKERALRGTWVFSFSDYGIPEGAEITCDYYPDTFLTVLEKNKKTKRNRVLVKEKNSATWESSFTEIVKDWSGNENFFYGLKDFCYQGKRLNGVITPEAMPSVYKEIKYTDSDEEEESDIFSTASDSPIEANEFPLVLIADFVYDLLCSEKATPLTSGLYSFALINCSRELYDPALNAESNRIFAPSDLQFICKMTTLTPESSVDYDRLCISDYSGYVLDNELSFRETGRLKLKSVALYYGRKEERVSVYWMGLKDKLYKEIVGA